MRRIAHIVLLILLATRMTAQTPTIIVGDVMNTETGEPIANAHIYFRGTDIGTTSDQEGSFALKVLLDKQRTLLVSSLGYQTESFKISPGQMAGLQVSLKEKQALLPELLARPGKNPALPIMEGVRAHRKENDRYLHSDMSQDMTETILLSVSHIGARQLKRNLWRQLQDGMVLAGDSTWMLPLYRTEHTVRLSGSHLSRLATIRDEALIFTPTDYTALLPTEGNISFYSSAVPIMGKSFLSPLASTGNTYYNYYLADSVSDGMDKLYLIRFRTKNPFYATFDGEMSIDSATYAIRRVTAHTSPQVTINHLTEARLSQTFDRQNRLTSQHLHTVLDFAVAVDTTHRVMPTAVIDYMLQNKEAERSASGTDSLPQSTAEEPGLPHVAMDSLSETPAIRVAKWLATIITTGYIPTGSYVDIGHIEEILQVNEHETVHIGLPLRTSERLMKNVCLEANVAYGIRDKAWKGMGRVSFNLPTPRRNILSLEYRDHYAWTELDDFSSLQRENNMGYGLMDFTSYAFLALRRPGTFHNTAARRRQLQMLAQTDWHDNVETRLYARIGWQNYGDPLVGYHRLPYFSYQTLGGIVRLGWHERKTDLWFRRIHARTLYPVLHIGVEAGSYHKDGRSGYGLYSHLHLLIKHTVDMGVGGELTYAVQAGCIFGQVPYPLLYHFEGNHTYAYDPYRFTLMNNFQYAADRYVTLHADWNGRGILFNLIPGVRYAGLRELVSFKCGWGGLRDSNREVLSMPEGMQAATVPYVEIGCGIGNILRIGEIYSVWRLTHRSDLSSPLWAMRFRLHIGY